MDRILAEKTFLSFYGDDFTGSTDVMESLALNGIPAALFLQPPSPEELDAFELKIGIGAATDQKKLRAFGVAGVARSLSPEGMDRELPPIFRAISQIPTDFFHYKVCSTFDSAPHVGNIGHATKLALDHFPSPYIPILVGAPSLNRFVVFAHLFARVDQTTYRIDRHPTMSKHPVTPMTESDLRVHLSRQTTRPVNLMDIFALDNHASERQKAFLEGTKHPGEYLLFDTITEAHLIKVGELILAKKKPGTQLLVGSSGMNYALAFALQGQGSISKPSAPASPGQADKLVIMAGSCSPTTATQIQYMIDQGHADIRIDSLKLINEIERSTEIERVKKAALEAIAKGRAPVMYTAMGPDDPVIERTKQLIDRQKSIPESRGDLLSSTQGVIVREILDNVRGARLVVAGGDTSGYVSRALGITALETLCPIAPGAPLCVAHSSHPKFDGLEVSLKGGQNGNQRYFESILLGKTLNEK